jgi:ferredoxin
MKIRVDTTLCSGHARCIVYGPDVYRLDELGYNSTNIDDVAPELHEQARRGAESCPEGAITIIEE